MVLNLLLVVLILVLNGIVENISGFGVRQGVQQGVRQEDEAHTELNTDGQDYMIANQELSEREMKQIFTSFNSSVMAERKVSYKRDTRKSKLKTMDVIWSMFHSCQLGSTTGVSVGDKGFWSSIRHRVLAGSIVEIGGCLTSLSLAGYNSSTTVLSLVTDGKSYKNCELSSVFNRNTNNFVLSKVSVEEIQSWSDTLATSPVLIGNLILNRFTSLCQNLLPHEFIQLLGNLFITAQQIFITDFTIPSQMEWYFKENWDSPSILFNIVCKHAGLSCDVNEVYGYDVWGSEDSVFHVTIHHSHRQLEKAFCSQVTQQSECSIRYSTSPNTDVVIVDDYLNKIINYTINNNSIPLSVLPLDIEISIKSKEILMKKLLDLTRFHGDIENVILDGTKIHIGPAVGKSEGLIDQSDSIKGQNSIPQHYGIVNSEPNVASNLQSLANNIEEKMGRENKIVENNKNQFNNLGRDMDREVKSVDETQKHRIDDVIDRERKNVGQQHTKGDNFDSKGGNIVFNDATDTMITKEEKQIHSGLIYLTKLFKPPTGKKTKHPASMTLNQTVHNKTTNVSQSLNHRNFRKQPIRNKLVNWIQNLNKSGKINNKNIMQNKNLPLKENSKNNGNHILGDNTDNIVNVPRKNIVQNEHLYFQKNSNSMVNVNYKILENSENIVNRQLLIKNVPFKENSNSKYNLNSNMETKLNIANSPQQNVLENEKFLSKEKINSNDIRNVQNIQQNKNSKDYVNYNYENNLNIANSAQQNVLLNENPHLNSKDMVNEQLINAVNVQKSANHNENVPSKGNKKLNYFGNQILSNNLDNVNSDFPVRGNMNLNDDSNQVMPNVQNIQDPVAKAHAPEKNIITDTRWGKPKLTNRSISDFEKTKNMLFKILNKNQGQELDKNQEMSKKDMELVINGKNRKNGEKEKLIKSRETGKIEANSENAKISNSYKSRKILEIGKNYEHIKDTQTVKNSQNMRKLLSVPSQVKESVAEYLRNKFDNSKGLSEKSYRLSKPVNKRTRSHGNGERGGEKIEEDRFDKEWPTIKPYIHRLLTFDKIHNIMVYGSKYHCLLSSKLSMLYPQSNIITVLSTQNEISTINRCRKIIHSLPRENNLLFINDLRPGVVDSIYRSPQFFKLQVLEKSILTNIIQNGDAFPLYLGRLLTNAEVTILELPPFSHLEKALKILERLQFRNNSNSLTRTKGIIYHALQLVEAEFYPIQTMNKPGGNTVLLLIQLKSFTRKVTLNCEGKESIMKYDIKTGVTVSIDRSHDLLDITSAINLQYLLSLGLQPDERVILFMEYLYLPIKRDMCPVDIVWTNEKLIHRQLNLKLNESYSLQQTIQQLKSEIHDSKFLYLDVNNHDRIVTSISQDYPNSTFVCLRSEKDKGDTLYNQTLADGIRNIAVGTEPLNQKISTRLLQSPDIFRYIFIGYQEFLNNLMQPERLDFNSILGNTVSSSITTFIQVPSSQIISLAATTLYPDTFASPGQNVYLSDAHPLPPFLSTERDIIYQSAKADVDINITTEVLPPLIDNNNNLLPWKLIRIDIKQLLVKVGHHFGYTLDGHERKYFQHVKTFNKSAYEVHLVREMDELKIPYGQVTAVSLIALLRMGLVERQKTEFYKQFLDLPLYEDMATWNMVFRHGKIKYIDYDTKDVLYDKIMPLSAKVMGVLINYQRTVADLGKCGEKAGNGLGFHYISPCVGSAFSGPCKDPAFPVPCGDKTCKSTYIECLRSLQNQLDLLLTDPGNADDKNVIEEKPSDWSFNRFGAITKT